jgi:hypothetical protein
MTRAVSRSIAAVGAATLLFSGGAAVLASHAGAAAKPKWEVSSAKDPNEVGTLALYNSHGKQVTSGSVTASPIAAYIVGSKSDTKDAKATAYLAEPKKGTPAGAWYVEQQSLSTSYPVTGSAPSVVKKAKGPVVTGHATDESIATFLDDLSNRDTSTKDGYGNTVQLRVKTSTNGTYQSMDLVVSGIKSSGGVITAGTWKETYPGLKTTTTLKVSPSGSVKAGKVVTLKATEKAGSKHVAGKIQFKDKGKKVGKAITVSKKGVATLKTKSLPGGKNVITAVFTPKSPTYATSVSSAKKLKVIEKALKNTKKPTLSSHNSGNAAKAGTKEYASHGTWSPKPTSYRYQWYVGAKKIAGATKSSVTLKTSEVGKKVSCAVTAVRAHKKGTAKSKTVTVKA